MTNGSHSVSEIVEAMTLDLWNEHHYQITATSDFYAELRHNLGSGKKEGDEGALSSALIHTRSLLEFYAPALRREHSESIWWVTALGSIPANNHDWQVAIGRDWAHLNPWRQPIHTFLAHLSWERRSLALPEPPDAQEQRWPLLDLTTGSLALLDRYVDYVRTHGALGSAIVTALEDVQRQARDLAQVGNRIRDLVDGARCNLHN